MAALAATVVSTLASARKAAQLYPSAHPAHSDAMDALVQAVRDASGGAGILELNLHQGRLYDGSHVLPDDIPGSSAVAEALEARQIESLAFSPHFGRIDAAGLTDVLSLRPTALADVAEELSERGVTAVAVAVLDDGSAQEREERDRQRELDRALYQELLRSLQHLVSSLAKNGRPDLGAAAGTIAQVARRLSEDPGAVMALAWMRGASDHLVSHSVNVSIYAVMLGRTLGLPEEGLTSLGTAALMHDVGKLPFMDSVSDDAASCEALHSEVGADMLARIESDDPAPMLVAYEHHMHADGGGMPARPPEYVPHPFSRMVAVADRYDNLTNPAAGAEPLTPDQAIVQVLREAGTMLDPFFARLFAKSLGVFPVGCLVRLSDHSVGVVCRAGTDAVTPVVRRTYDAAGNELEEPETLALSESELRIVEVVPPANLSIAIHEKL